MNAGLFFGGRPTLPAHVRRDVCFLVLVVLAIAGCLYMNVRLTFPQYLSDPQLASNPDAVHYLLLGHNIVEHGEFSRNQQPPFTPDPLRTPVFPLVAGLAELAGVAVVGVFAFNVLCQATTACLVYLTCLPFGRFPALSAGLIIAVDAMLAVSNFETMTEPLYCCLSATAAFAATNALTFAPGREPTVIRSLRDGAIFGVATLTRPAGLYAPVVVLILGSAVSLSRRTWAPLRYGFLCASASALVVAPWIVRNYHTFGIPAISSIAEINYLYWSGGSAYALAHDLTLEQAQAEVSRQFGTEPSIVCHNPWNSKLSVLEMAREQRAAIPILWQQYPSELCLAAVIGTAKSLVAHNVTVLAYFTGTDWNPPGLSRLLQGDVSEFHHQLTVNPPVLIGVWAWQELLALVVLATSLIGIVRGLRSPQYLAWTLILVAFLVYNVAGIAVVGMDCYARHRIAMIPLMAALAAVGLTSGSTLVDIKRTPAEGPME